MSQTSKSPRDVIVEAWLTAFNCMAAFSHRDSPKKFTQQQLFACVVLKNFLRADYRGLCRTLRDCLALAEAIVLTSIPRFTTFQKTTHRLLQGPQPKRLLDETVEQMLGRNPGIRTVAADFTGLACTTASGYCMRRRAKAESAWKTMAYHHFPKLGLVCDTSNHFILAFQTS